MQGRRKRGTYTALDAISSSHPRRKKPLVFTLLAAKDLP